MKKVEKNGIDSESLYVTIVSATENVFEGKVWAVASTNKVGPFSIVPGHAGFISLIEEKVELSENDKDNKKIVIPIKKAVLHCRDNKVRILIGSSGI